MSDAMITASEVALTLVGQYGRSALVYVEEQVKAARKCDDWHKVKAWYDVGSEVDRLLKPHFINPPHKVHRG